jgi:murein DD-endopeptidase MepM/ murein hydrolase activator NlpD
MANFTFYKIVNREDIHISIPTESYFSIGTSPYYAHQHALAIDIYHKISIENYKALSPVSGRVIKIKKQLAPTPKFLGGINRDYVLLIENKNNPDIVYKILHVYPEVQVGDSIKIGDPLGETLKNGYFAPWSSPHIHLEVRKSRDPIRARGGIPFKLSYEESKKSHTISDENYTSVQKIPIQIHSIYPDYLLVYFPENLYYKIGRYFGIKGTYNGSKGILDGGIPQYKNGIMHMIEKPTSRGQSPIYLAENNIGTMLSSFNGFGFLKFQSVGFLINGQAIRGISLFLASFKPLVKIILLKKNQFMAKKNSKQLLSITKTNSDGLN